jgi:hypothetical protein
MPLDEARRKDPGAFRREMNRHSTTTIATTGSWSASPKLDDLSCAQPSMAGSKHGRAEVDEGRIN